MDAVRLGRFGMRVADICGNVVAKAETPASGPKPQPEAPPPPAATATEPNKEPTIRSTFTLDKDNTTDALQQLPPSTLHQLDSPAGDENITVAPDPLHER